MKGVLPTMKFHFIINPKSGSLSFQQVVDYIRVYAQNHPNFEFDLHLTQYVGHGKEIASTISGPNNCVVACGGDGTINEVLNGLNLECTLGCVPIGTGNDFVRMLGYPKKLSIEEWIVHTIEGKVIEADFGLCNNERFINSCNTGVDTDVLLRYNKLRQTKLPTNIGYVVATAQSLIRPKFNKVMIQIDDKEPFEKETLLCTLMNGAYYGNGFLPTPSAQINDGVLDLCIADKLNLYQIGTLITKYKAGKHTDDKAVIMSQCQKLHISSDHEIVYALDGEVRTAYSMDCSISQDKIKVMAYQAVESE